MIVSIITPSFNSSKFIRETHQSILNQTHKNWEWLITDDGSSDGSWDLLTQWAKEDSRIKPQLNSKNSGAAVSRNNAIKRAKGDILAFLDSDDIWLETKLERHLAFMEKNNANISFTPYYLIDETGKDLNRVIDQACSGIYNYNDMLKKRATMGCCTVMVRKSAFPDVYMPLVRAGQDYALWLKLLKSNTSAHIFNVPLSKYRIVAGSLSRNKYKKALKIWQVYREIEQLNIFKALYVFNHYAIRALFKLNETKFDKNLDSKR